MSPHFHIYALLPVLANLVALVLSFLCVFAGNRPGFLDDYAVMTLNVSRIGQDAVINLDEKILDFNATQILQKRSEPVALFVPRAEITSAPSILAAVDLRARDLDSFIDGLTAEVGSLKSKAGGAVTSVEQQISSRVTAVASAVESKASSVEGIVASKISSVVATIQTSAVNAVDEMYGDFVTKMDLHDFYAIHMLTTCEGTYVTNNGANITVGTSQKPANGTHIIVDTCERHSLLNPMSLIRILFEIAIALIGLATLLAIWGAVRFSRKAAVINIIGSLPAFGLLVVAAAASHVLAIGASAILNFFGGAVGVEVTYGGKFIALAWAAVIMLLVNIALWTILLFTGDHLPGGTRSNREMTNQADQEKVPPSRDSQRRW